MIGWLPYGSLLIYSMFLAGWSCMLSIPWLIWGYQPTYHSLQCLSSPTIVSMSIGDK